MTSVGHPGWLVDTGINHLTPAVWHAIASPAGTAALPTLTALRDEYNSEAGHNGFEVIRSLWNAVFQVSVTSLGWQSPALGFLQWRELGYPTDDPRLEVVGRLLGEDLDRHAAEALAFLFEPHCWGKELTLLDPAVRHRVLAEHRPNWLDRYVADQVRHPYPSPFWGGTDALHMQVHVPIVGLGNLPIPAHGATNQSTQYIRDRDALLILDEYANWYGNLTRFGNSLGARDDGRSWRVDVVVKPVGWLGTFRLSRLTGRWFSGPHSIHEWGSVRT
jgi:hypothetical protein